MEGALIVLIPISVLIVAGIVGVLWWAARHGQFDDMEGPAHAILMDDDTPPGAPPAVRDAAQDRG
jgi:cbb3-type cytochrome oxidase maturation protein